MIDVQDQIANKYGKLIDNLTDPSQAQALRQHIAQSVQDGSLYGYLGVPLVSKLTGKISELQQAGALKAGLLPQQPIAQQTLAQAAPQAPQQMPQQAPQQAAPQPTPQAAPQQGQPGIAAMPSNLPTEMARGGIASFASGGYFDDEDEETDDGFDKYTNPDITNLMPPEIQDAYEQNYASATPSPGIPSALPQEGLQHPALQAPQDAQGILGAPAAQPFVKKQEYQESSIKTPEMPKPITASRERTQIERAEPAKDADLNQARKFNVGNLRPSGFTYPGQIGTNKSGFALFKTQEDGIAALDHDIKVKIGRGVDTPEKFISIYAPPKSKGGDNPDETTNAYIRNVATALGIKPGDKIPNTPEGIAALRQAIIKQEGSQYTHNAAGGVIKYYGDPTQNPSGDQLVQDDDYVTVPGMVTGTPYADAMAKAGNTYTPLKMPSAVGPVYDPYGEQAKGGSDIYSSKRDPNAQPATQAMIDAARGSAYSFNRPSGSIFDSATNQPSQSNAQRPSLDTLNANEFQDPERIMTRPNNGSPFRISPTPPELEGEDWINAQIDALEKKAGKKLSPEARLLAADEFAKQLKLTNVPGAKKPMPPAKVYNPNAPYRPIPQKGQDVSANLDQEDKERGMGLQGLDALATPGSAGATTAAAPASPYDEFRDYLKEQKAAMAHQADVDKYMALLTGSLGALGAAGRVKPGEVQTPFGAWGEGAMSGVNYYMNAQKNQAAEKTALLKSQLGLLNANEISKFKDAQLAANIENRKAVLEQKDRQIALENQQKVGKLLETRIGAAERNAMTKIGQDKLGALDPEHARMLIEMEKHNELKGDATYRKNYKILNGVDPYENDTTESSSGRPRGKYDPKTGYQRAS